MRIQKKTDYVNTYLLNLHQIRQRNFFGTSGSVPVVRNFKPGAEESGILTLFRLGGGQCAPSPPPTDFCQAVLWLAVG